VWRVGTYGRVAHGACLANLNGCQQAGVAIGVDVTTVSSRLGWCWDAVVVYVKDAHAVVHAGQLGAQS
jgi:hypothetical protein